MMDGQQVTSDESHARFCFQEGCGPSRSSQQQHSVPPPDKRTTRCQGTRREARGEGAPKRGWTHTHTHRQFQAHIVMDEEGRDTDTHTQTHTKSTTPGQEGAVYAVTYRGRVCPATQSLSTSSPSPISAVGQNTYAYSATPSNSSSSEWPTKCTTFIKARGNITLVTWQHDNRKQRARRGHVCVLVCA